MDVLQQYNQSRFIGFVPQIRKDMGAWYIVEVSLTGETEHNVSYIALKLGEYFAGKDGVIFICNNENILVLAHMGKDVKGETLSSGIHEKLPKHSCTAKTSDVTPEGLVKIQLRLEGLEKNNKSRPDILEHLRTRQRRKERVVMIVDDDMLMRSVFSRAFRTRSRVIEFKDADNVLDTYLEYLPDIVFLDIHLPGGSGIGLLKQILDFDKTAHVIIVSSDSVKDNILSAKEFGAQGFIAKPFTLDQLEICYNKCPTVNSRRQ